MPDMYTLRARLAPALLLVVPGIALLIAGVVSATTVGRIVGLCSGATGVIIAGLVRDRGRRLQPKLWDSWGGSATQRRLRWTGGLPVDSVEQLHSRVEAVTGDPLPDASSEAADPADADRRYDDAIEYLREATRDHRDFGLVFAENVDYGFRRNTLGLRRLGIGVNLACGAIAVVFLVVGPRTFVMRAEHWGAALVICGLGEAFWILVVNEGWVRTAAENYADQLLGALRRLPRASL